MQIEFLTSLVIIFGVSGAVVFFLGKLKIPSIVGFLVAGVILGPHGFGFIKNVHDVELLAEIGVILLMFTIGLEFSLKNLMMLRTAVLGGGLLQVGLTTGAVVVISYLTLQEKLNTAVFNGFLVALSSTAIATKLLLDRAEINTPHGRTSMGILIFQDLCVVPFVLLVPVLAGKGESIQDIVITLLKASLVIGGVLLSSRWGVPHLLHQVVRTKSRDLFVITIILLCAGTALLTSELGLSLALGAFLAGIVISESEYASQAVSDILPFKESFTGLFFISIGMLMDIRFFAENFFTVAAVVTLILLLKVFTGSVSAYAVGRNIRHSLQTGFYLSQVGEFSFVLASAGRMEGLIGDGLYQIFLTASVFTMLISPLMAGVSAPLSAWLVSGRSLGRLDRSLRGTEKESYPTGKSRHVIIAGFGVSGQNLARVLRESAIPYVIIELNGTTVRRMKKKGEPIYYGDGTSAEILHKLHIRAARMLVVAISDAAATRRIVQVARHESPSVHILVRTRYVTEVDDLKALGANEVIPEEFETSVEMFSRVLHHYGVPRNLIHEQVELVRQDSYRMLRALRLPHKRLAERYDFLKGLGTETYQLRETSPAEGHSVKEIGLRSATGATIIAVQRGKEIHHNPSPDFVLKAGDIVLLVGDRASIERALEYLESEALLIQKYH